MTDLLWPIEGTFLTPTQAGWKQGLTLHLHFRPLTMQEIAMLHHRQLRIQRARAIASTQRRVWPATPLLALLVLALTVLAAGCGAATGHGSAQPQGVDAVHEAWVAAVREGDADTALALTDPELPQREQFAREAVSRMQDYLTSPASPTGALEGVTVEPVSDGVGRSVWQFAEKRWCYRAELVSRAERWFVSRWGQTSVDCEA